MNLMDYQKVAMSTALPQIKEDLAYAILGLCSEAGELAGKYKKELRDMKYDDEGLFHELGDVLWYVALAAEVLGTNLEHIAVTNINKLMDRQKRGVIGGSGDKR